MGHRRIGKKVQEILAEQLPLPGDDELKMPADEQYFSPVPYSLEPDTLCSFVSLSHGNKHVASTNSTT